MYEFRILLVNSGIHITAVSLNRIRWLNYLATVWSKIVELTELGEVMWDEEVHNIAMNIDALLLDYFVVYDLNKISFFDQVSVPDLSYELYLLVPPASTFFYESL